ncbi:uncharacterized protein [Hetaerina americana]|uniref:uncharacterized protein n=1 Tax=Hetaerina americana TaxID=62018 RepID=UPI003A7F2B85
MSYEREYIERHLGEPLTLALTDICLKRPRDPILYLGQWLLHWKINKDRLLSKRIELEEFLHERQKQMELQMELEKTTELKTEEKPTVDENIKDEYSVEEDGRDVLRSSQLMEGHSFENQEGGSSDSAEGHISKTQERGSNDLTEGLSKTQEERSFDQSEIETHFPENLPGQLIVDTELHQVSSPIFEIDEDVEGEKVLPEMQEPQERRSSDRQTSEVEIDQ